MAAATGAAALLAAAALLGGVAVATLVAVLLHLAQPRRPLAVPPLLAVPPVPPVTTQAHGSNHRAPATSAEKMQRYVHHCVPPHRVIADGGRRLDQCVPQLCCGLAATDPDLTCRTACVSSACDRPLPCRRTEQAPQVLVRPLGVQEPSAPVATSGGCEHTTSTANPKNALGCAGHSVTAHRDDCDNC